MNKNAKLGMAKRALAIAMAAAMTVSGVPVQAAAKPALSTFTKATTVNRYGNTTKTISLQNVTLKSKSKVTWAAIDSKGKKSTIATISSTGAKTAKITYKKTGTVYFTAKYTTNKKGAKATTLKSGKVTIKQGATGVMIYKSNGTSDAGSSMSVTTGQTVQFKSLALPASKGKTQVTASGQTSVTYKIVEGADYATIDSKGKFVANEDVGVGDKTVVVKVTGYKGTDSISIKIKGAIEETPVVVPTPAAIEITEVKQIGAKKVEVKFNKEVAADTKITVTKGTTPVNLDADAGSVVQPDAKSVIVTTVSNLTKDMHTFMASGTGVMLTTDGAMEVAAISSINTLRDEAITDANSTTKASFTFACYNQFMEAMPMPSTVNVSVSVDSNPTITVGNADNKYTNTVSFKWADGTISPLNPTVVVSMVDTGSGKSLAGKILTISSKRSLTTISGAGIIDATGKSTMVTEGSDFVANKQYVAFDAKDQYGDTISPELLVSSSAVTVSMPNSLSIANMPKSLKGADGKMYLAYEIKAATANSIGVNMPANVMLVSTTNGKTANVDVAVEHSIKVKTIEIMNVVGATGAAGSIIEGEAFKLSVVAKDFKDNVITDLKVLNDASKSLGTSMKVALADGSTSNIMFEKAADGTILLVYPKASPQVTTIQIAPAANPAGIVVKTYSGVKAAAKATSIIGLKETGDNAVDKTVVAGSIIPLAIENFTIADQYGRVMSVSSKADNTVGTVNNYRVLMTTGTGAQFTVTNSSISGSAVIASGQTTSLSAISAATNTNYGTEKIKFELQQTNGTVWSRIDDMEAVFTRTSAKEVKSYKIVLGKDKIWAATMNAITIDDAKYGASLKVYGVLADNKEVLLTKGTDYEVILPSNMKADNGIITASSVMFTDSTNAAETKDVSVKIVSNLDGQIVTKTLTVDEAAPVATTIAFNNDNAKLVEGAYVVTLPNLSSSAAAGTTVAAITIEAMASSGTSIVSPVAKAGKALISVKDQYGVEVNAAAAGVTMLFTNFKNIAYTGNGTAAATIDFINTTDSKATITFELANGQKITALFKTFDN